MSEDFGKFKLLTEFVDEEEPDLPLDLKVVVSGEIITQRVLHDEFICFNQQAWEDRFLQQIVNERLKDEPTR